MGVRSEKYSNHGSEATVAHVWHRTAAADYQYCAICQCSADEIVAKATLQHSQTEPVNKTHGEMLPRDHGRNYVQARATEPYNPTRPWAKLATDVYGDVAVRCCSRVLFCSFYPFDSHAVGGGGGEEEEEEVG